MNAARHVLMDEARRRRYDLRNGFLAPGSPPMRPPAARTAQRKQATATATTKTRRQPEPARRRSLWRRIKQAASADFTQRRDPDIHTVTLFERKPRLTKFVLVPLGITAILLAAVITVIVT